MTTAAWAFSALRLRSWRDFLPALAWAELPRRGRGVFPTAFQESRVEVDGKGGKVLGVMREAPEG